MDEFKLTALIKTKPSWNSNELLKAIKNLDSVKTVTFSWIGGYELLRDGTRQDTYTDVKSVKDMLDDYEIEYDNRITDLIELSKSVEEAWADYNDDGGGSGWIEY